MRSAAPIPSSPLASRLRRGAWLASLALVLALHPAAGAHAGASHGLASLLRELLCGCAECSGEDPALAQAEPSCCGHAGKGPAPRASDCESGGICTCSHPDEVPVPEDGPLASPASGGELLAQLGLQRGAAERTPCAVSGGVPGHEPTALAPPGRPDLAARGALRHAARPAGAPETGARLARLSTLLL